MVHMLVLLLRSMFAILLSCLRAALTHMPVPTTLRKCSSSSTFWNPPSEMRLEVMHKEDAPVLYIQKYNYFITYTMEELYDIAAAMPQILKKMEECRDVVLGRSQYAPKSKKDMMRTLKASRRTCELEKEEAQMMYRQHPGMIPRYNKTLTEDPEKDDIEEEEEEDQIELVVHAQSSRNSRRK